MHEVLNMVLNFIVLLAWVFLVWGIIKDNKARKPERAKDRNFLVKTSWVLFSGSILWFVVGVTNAFTGTPFLLEGFLTFVIGYKAYTLNLDIRALKGKR
jgi:uncharacterized membrane protein